VLIFVGAKMLLADVFEVPVAVSLGIIAGILATSILSSFFKSTDVPRKPLEN